MSEYVVHYIAAFYIGPNRNYANYQKLFSENPLSFAEKHFQFLSLCNNHIKKATFVFNCNLDEHLKKQLENYKLENIELSIEYYDGLGYSYGSWNHIIKKNVYSDDYFFLIEDDYIPTCHDFYIPFVERCSLEYPYVCAYAQEKSPGVFFASSSNGLLRAENCKIVYEKYNQLFSELNCSTLELAWTTQMNFLDNFYKEGFNVRDILDEYCTPHMLNCNINHLVKFGNENAPVLLEPIVVPLT